MPGPLPHSQPCSVRSPALRNHTRCKPSRRSDLGVSGLGNPGTNPKASQSLHRGRRASRGRSSPSPGPRQRTGKPGGKGRGGGSRRLETPTPGGFPPARQICALSPPPTLGDSDGGGSCQADPGQGRERAGAGGSDPRGGKLGGGRWRGLGPGLPGAGALAHLLVPWPGPRDGQLRLRADSARRGARGTGHKLSGPGGAIPASHRRRRRLGSVAQLGLRGSAGGAGKGWGRGRGRAPPRLGLGLGAPGWLRPRATRPGLRTWRSAGSEGEHLGPRRGAHPHTDPGAPRHRQPPTRTGKDTCGHQHTQGYTHTDLGMLCHREPPTRTRTGTQRQTLARVHTQILSDLGTLHQIPFPTDIN